MTRSPDSRSSILQLLKLSFGGQRDLDLPLSCYGKLPVYRDFIRNALAGAEAQAFKQWLDRGFSRHWEAQDACREHRFGAHAAVLAFPGTGRTLLAFLWGSADNDGLRRFPFALFVSFAPSRGAGTFGAIDAAAQLARLAQERRRHLEECPDLDSVVRAVRDRRVAISLPDEDTATHRLREGLDGVTVAALAESLYGEEADRSFPALLAWLRRHGGPSPDRPVVARLPGSPLLPGLTQAALWVGLLRDDRGRTPATCNVLVPLEGDSRLGPVLVGREPRPEDVLALHPDMPGYEAAEDLRRKVPGQDAAATGWLADHGAEPAGSLLATRAREG